MHKHHITITYRLSPTAFSGYPVCTSPGFSTGAAVGFFCVQCWAVVVSAPLFWGSGRVCLREREPGGETQVYFQRSALAEALAGGVSLPG